MKGQAPPVLLEGLIGRSALVEELERHLERLGQSYMFVGPPGAGKLLAMKAMAKAVLCPLGGCGSCGVCLGVEQEIHPDCTILQRSGAYLSVDEARDAVVLASRAPSTTARRVIILPEAHLFERAAPALLKSLEEASPATLFLLSAESLPDSLAPLVSRCVRVNVPPPSTKELVGYLIRLGFDETKAQRSVLLASGRLDRSLTFARSEETLEAVEVWRSVLSRLSKDPVQLAVLAGELEATLPKSVKTKARPHKRTDPSLVVADQGGTRPLSRSEELALVRGERRLRADLIRAGLEQILNQIVILGSGGGVSADSLRGATDAVLRASSAIRRNANEAVLLRALLFELAGLELNAVVPE